VKVTDKVESDRLCRSIESESGRQSRKRSTLSVY
jgi:hypothetical protein